MLRNILIALCCITALSCATNRSAVQSDKASSKTKPASAEAEEFSISLDDDDVVEEVVMVVEEPVQQVSNVSNFNFEPVKSIRFNPKYAVSGSINDRYDYYWIKNDQNRYAGQGVVDKDGNVLLPHIFSTGSNPNNYELVLSINRAAWGLFNLNEKRWTIPIIYQELYSLGNNVFAAKKDNKWGLIDNNNVLLAPFAWNRQERVHGIDNYVMVSIDDIWGIYSIIERKLTVPCEYTRLRRLDRESYFVVTKGTKANIVDINNKPIFKKWYDEVRTSSLNSEYFIVRESGRYGVVDRNEKIIVPITYLEFGDSHYSDGSYLVRNKDGKYGFMLIDGRVTLPFNYDNVKKGYYNNIISIQNGKCGLVRVNNGMPTEILTCEFDNISDGAKTLVVEKGGKFGLLNQFGKQVTEIEYTTLEPLKDRDGDQPMYRAAKGKQFFLLNEQGRVVTEGNFSDIAPLYRTQRESYYAPSFLYLKAKDKNGKYGVIDKLGKTLMEPQFEDVVSENDNLLVIRSNGKCGLYSLLSQKQVVDFKYDNIIRSTTNYIGFVGTEIDFITLKSDGPIYMSTTGKGKK